jgi:hypothetical protein
LRPPVLVAAFEIQPAKSNRGSRAVADFSRVDAGCDPHEKPPAPEILIDRNEFDKIDRFALLHS